VKRFVVLEHHWNGVHWDFMLEVREALRTWALQGPPDGPSPVVAKALPDHRLLYLDYEGPVRGDRGYVRQWDKGHFEGDATSPREVVVQLHGKKLRGQAHLILRDDGLWSFSFSATPETAAEEAG
jgi:hypothetical protein